MTDSTFLVGGGTKQEESHFPTFSFFFKFHEAVLKGIFARHCEGEARSNPLKITNLDCFLLRPSQFAMTTATLKTASRG